MAQCKAKSKRSGERCKKDAVPGRDVCHIHGGKTPRGLDSPNTKTGRYSKDLPTRLMARYLEGQNDPDLLDLREEVALIDARIGDLLERVDTGEAGANWRRVASEVERGQQAIQDYRSAVVSQDAKKMASGFKEVTDVLSSIGRITGAGIGDYAAWDEIGKLVEQRRKLAESERKHQIELQQAITAERALLMIGAIGAIIAKHVSDKSTINKIATDIRTAVILDAGGQSGAAQ